MKNLFAPKFNFDRHFADWVEGNKRVLFITGLSGAGKTSMAKDLAYVMEAKLISLDGYLLPLIREKFGANPDYEKIFFEQGVQLLLENHPEGKIIIEGCHVGWFNVEELKDHAVMYVETGLIVSCWRALRRAFSKENLKKRGIWGFWEPLTFNYFQYSHMQGFRNKLVQLK